MEIQINYYETACGITFANKNITTWKKLHNKKCDKCSKSIEINKGKFAFDEINNTFNKDCKIKMNIDKNKYGDRI